ncbi:MAG: alpha-amylase family glycosyl hydrolase [Candidatus Izemoplasmatales bacterium]|nr:alpha-amylase family glycosyl hydrolase [Candidatus Izemoplasmatales bacterium]
MKKVQLIIIMILGAFALLACNGTKEYQIIDEHLQSQHVDDLYRVYYEIFLGSFSDSGKDGIGDIQGLINRLDYLNDGDPDSGMSLGITGIWLMPVMQSPSYHKYDVQNYQSIDENYGSLDDFAQLISMCDERGINVIIDLVLNHTSSQHPWFLQARNALRDNDLENRYLEYYTLVTEEEKESGKIYYPFYGAYFYEGNFSSSMPELNLDSALVKEEIVDIITFWFDLGVSGFRLDAIKYAFLNDTPKNIAFWNWFRDECLKIKEDAYIVGEVWSADNLILPYYECFSNFDFGMSMSSGAIAAAANNIESVDQYVDYLYRYRESVMAVNSEAMLTPFISNHDMNRAAGYLSVSEYRMHMAANLYLLASGVPFIYYGEEIGLKGSRASENTDANRRLRMLWGDKDSVKDPIGATYSSELQTNGTVKAHLRDPSSLYNHYKKLIMMRNANPEIARGAYTPLVFPEHFTFGGFISTYNQQNVGVFHNTGLTTITVDLRNYTSYEFTSINSYAGMDSATFQDQILTLGPLTSVILR